MRKEWKEFKDTEMLGTYHPESAVVREFDEGSYVIFRDTAYFTKEEGFVRERNMRIKDRCFHIISVFPNEPTATPTDKMLSLIDAEIKKENESA